MICLLLRNHSERIICSVTKVKRKTYSCEQIRKSWDNKVNYVTENSLKNTKEEAQKEFVDAFILRLLSEKNSGRLPMQISLIQPETLPMVVRCSIN